MMTGIHEYNKTGQIKRPSYKDIVTCFPKSWTAVSENCVRSGFLRAKGETRVFFSSQQLEWLWNPLRHLDILLLKMILGSYIKSLIKSKRMRWMGHVARMEKRNAYRILVGKP
jgi:hypothetical protein